MMSPWSDCYRMGRRHNVRGLLRLLRRPGVLTESAAVAVAMLARSDPAPTGLNEAVDPSSRS